MVNIEEQKNIISSAKDLDDDKKREVSTAASKMVKEGKKWVEKVEQDPGTAEEQAEELMKTLSANFIDKYKGDVASALKVTDPAGFAKCKKLTNDKARKCASTHVATPTCWNFAPMKVRMCLTSAGLELSKHEQKKTSQSNVSLDIN
ncbi:hypothetical protein HC256_004221 [Beauveria bassiana]|nr:hypothetical protein HC256_004221 [Beauveria bassiana]